jgi:hypothetical protein
MRESLTHVLESLKETERQIGALGARLQTVEPASAVEVDLLKAEHARLAAHIASLRKKISDPAR